MVKPSLLFRPSAQKDTRLALYAPPGSGYFTRDDEVSDLPDTYEPMMEYPGTMRPGRTPENMPFHDLPIGDDDPEPIPWPHFQQISWHHRYRPPHPYALSMEEFIEKEGRWASPEQEAEMRAGARRTARDRREQAEREKKSNLIIDDDDEDEDSDLPTLLGGGEYAQLGSGGDDDDDDDDDEDDNDIASQVAVGTKPADNSADDFEEDFEGFL